MNKTFTSIYLKTGSWVKTANEINSTFKIKDGGRLLWSKLSAEAKIPHCATFYMRHMSLEGHFICATILFRVDIFFVCATSDFRYLLPPTLKDQKKTVGEGRVD